jgi:hypothetical protein
MVRPPNGQGTQRFTSCARCVTAPQASSVSSFLYMRRKLDIWRSVFGSGSCEKDGSVSIVTMKKEKQACFVHNDRLGKRERHVHKTSQTLSQRVIPPLHMSCFSRFFSDSRVLFLWDHCLIDCPEIRETMTSTIALRNSLPQALACLFAPMSNRIAHHLARLATQGDPNPSVVCFFEHK